MKRSIVAACVVLGGLACPVGSPALMLAEDGRAQAAIVVAAEAAPPVRHAAEELRKFLGEVTGATFDLQNAKKGDGAHLLVGPAAARLADPGFTTEGLVTMESSSTRWART